jgi:hypothetical protein
MKSEVLNSKVIQKYSKYSIPELIKKADIVFHKWIRIRDEGQGCICCGGKPNSEIQAGHYFSAGKYPNLRYNPHNVNGQAKGCNYFKSGNLLEYRKHLVRKIGIESVEILEQKAAEYNRNGYKWDRYFLIEIILKYK